MSTMNLAELGNPQRVFVSAIFVLGNKEFRYPLEQ